MWLKRSEVLLWVSFLVALFSEMAAVWLFVKVFALGPLLAITLSVLVALAAFILFGVILTMLGL
jgi:hypothetical protein